MWQSSPSFPYPTALCLDAPSQQSLLLSQYVFFLRQLISGCQIRVHSWALGRVPFPATVSSKPKNLRGTTHTHSLQNLCPIFLQPRNGSAFPGFKDTLVLGQKAAFLLRLRSLYDKHCVCPHATSVSLMRSFPGFTCLTSQIIMVMLNLWYDSPVAGDSSFLSFSLGEAASNSLK